MTKAREMHDLPSPCLANEFMSKINKAISVSKELSYFKELWGIVASLQCWGHHNYTWWVFRGYMVPGIEHGPLHTGHALYPSELSSQSTSKHIKTVNQLICDIPIKFAKYRL